MERARSPPTHYRRQAVLLRKRWLRCHRRWHHLQQSLLHRLRSLQCQLPGLLGCTAQGPHPATQRRRPDGEAPDPEPSPGSPTPDQQEKPLSLCVVGRTTQVVASQLNNKKDPHQTEPITPPTAQPSLAAQSPPNFLFSKRGLRKTKNKKQIAKYCLGIKHS